MKEIKSNNCIVVFLDILGYEDWVKEAKSPEAIYSLFKKILEDMQAMKEKHPQTKEFFKLIDFTIWSDSLIFVFNLDEIKDKKTFVSWFIWYLSLFIIEFINNTGYFLRGAIVYGSFIQQKIIGDDHRFIFSPAFISAVRLEKNMGVPRVGINVEFVDYVQKNDLLDDLIKKALKKDIYRQNYLDYYFSLYWIPGALKIAYLKTIKELITKKYPGIRDNDKKREKNLYFIDYHNQHVRNIFRAKLLEEDYVALELNKDELALPMIEIGIVEEFLDFPFKRDVKPDYYALLRRLQYLSIPEAKRKLLAIIIKNRIDESYNIVKDLSIEQLASELNNSL